MISRKGLDFESIVYPFDNEAAIKIWKPEFYGKYIRYFQKHKLSQAMISLPSLDILYECPSLMFLSIAPSIGSPDEYDFSPLYGREIKYLCCLNEYRNAGAKTHIGKVDFSQISGLESLKINVNRGTLNFNSIASLRSLSIGDFSGADLDLSDLFVSTELDTLRLM